MARPPSLLSINSSALWLLLLLASSIQRTTAHPFPKDDLHAAGYGYLMPRQCDKYCGYNNMYCCASGTECYTSNGIAGCSAAAGGGYNWYTSTWTETETFTTTYSSFFPAATGPAGGGKCVPPEGSGQIACGTICCANWQYCAHEGQCVANVGATTAVGGGGGGVVVPTTIVSGGQTITTQFSAPYRVTSGTATSTGGTADGASATSTAGVSPGGSSSQLSGGAIAGIVIGTLAGVALLLLICACCVVRGLWHGLLSLLGLRKKDTKETETIIEEERYARRGSTHSRRDAHGSWYGGAGGGRPSTVASRKEKRQGAGLLGLGAALGTLALLLGLRRDKNKKKTTAKTRSDVSSSYWSDSYTADSPSSRSSDRRTRRSARDSRAASRVTRTTHTHTRVSRAPSARSARSPR